MDCCTVCVLWLVTFASISGSDGLKNVRLSEPKDFLRYGEDAELRCEYDLEKVSLYAIKWYRNNQEFYRFVPKEVPPQQSFPNHHINVNLINSTERTVHVTNVTFTLTGKFKCVVTTESTFQTLEDSRDIVVVAIGSAPPSLQKDQETYHVGDNGTLECSLKKVSARVNVRWFINERLENNRTGVISVLKREMSPPEENFYHVISTLTFHVSSFLPFKIKCEMELGQLYAQSSSVLIQPVPRPATTLSTRMPSLLLPSSPGANVTLHQLPSKVDVPSSSKLNSSSFSENKNYFQVLQSTSNSGFVKAPAVLLMCVMLACFHFENRLY